MTFIKALKPVLTESSDLIIVRRNLEDRGPSASDHPRKISQQFDRCRVVSFGHTQYIISEGFSSKEVRYCFWIATSLFDDLPCSRCHSVEAGTRLNSHEAEYVSCSVENLNVVRAAPAASMTLAMVAC